MGAEREEMKTSLFAVVLALAVCLAHAGPLTFGVIKPKDPKDPKAAAKPDEWIDKCETTDEKFAEFEKALRANTIAVNKYPTEYYHWSDYKQCLRWHVQGNVDKGEMDFLTRPEAFAVLALSGPGMYLTTSTTSSAHFGMCATVFTLPDTTPVWKEDLAAKLCTNGKPGISAKTEIGKRIPFIHYYDTTQKWYVVHSPEPLTKVALEWKLTSNRLTGGNLVRFFTEVEEAAKDIVNKNHDQRILDNAKFLTSVYSLMYFFDPVSLLRAIIVNPKDPWQEFNPSEAGPYQAARLGFSYDLLVRRDWDDSKMLGLAKYNKRNFIAEASSAQPTIGDGKGQTVWADRVVDKIMHQLYAATSGGTNAMNIRTEEVRGGGDEANNTFEATGPMMDTMCSSIYIEPHATLKPGSPADKPTYLAYYFYPDAYRIKPALPYFKDADRKNLAKNYGDGTKTALGTMLKEIMKKYYGKPISAKAYDLKWNSEKEDDPSNWQKPYSVDALAPHSIMVESMSVHPATNFNGRTIRLLWQLMCVEAGLPSPVAFIPDMDLVLPIKDFVKFIDASTEQYERIQRAMVKKFFDEVIVKKGGKSDNTFYWDLGNGWMDIAKPLALLGVRVPKREEMTEDVLNMIKKRQWISFFDKFADAGWKTSRSTPAKDAACIMKVKTKEQQQQQKRKKEQQQKKKAAQGAVAPKTN